MYITMNRFRVLAGSAAEFEAMWLGRDSHLSAVPGFRSFSLLKGPASGDTVLYASHTVWDSEAAFREWTRSEAFRKAHSGAGGSKPLTSGYPELEEFEVIQQL